MKNLLNDHLENYAGQMLIPVKYSDRFAILRPVHEQEPSRLSDDYLLIKLEQKKEGYGNVLMLPDDWESTGKKIKGPEAFETFDRLNDVVTGQDECEKVFTKPVIK
jgi:hypothetical protein